MLAASLETQLGCGDGRDCFKYNRKVESHSVECEIDSTFEH